MGDNFFPEGLSRVLTLIGRPRIDQGCQTPLGGLEQLEKTDTPSAHAKRDVRVQVAGGIDAEDEPLMEQQVQQYTVYCEGPFTDMVHSIQRIEQALDRSVHLL